MPRTIGEIRVLEAAVSHAPRDLFPLAHNAAASARYQRPVIPGDQPSLIDGLPRDGIKRPDTRHKGFQGMGRPAVIPLADSG